MKKWMIFPALFALLFIACDKIPELPSETHTGANTFAYLVNGELSLPLRAYRPSEAYNDYPRAHYDAQTKILKIVGYGHNGQEMHFTVTNPRGLASMPIDTARFYLSNVDSYYYGGNAIGEITFTYLGIANNIVSGRFRFTGYKYDKTTDLPVGGSEPLTITKGVFDIKMN
ncbi:MAG: hypothetical protein LBT48_04170 [Prevotellaceae bacterium]|jgi:hypothetical protein|nr:hypothetical protein [Prevotellaceae bacterium]